MTRIEIITTARSYLGTPFHHQGRLKGIGVDCIGFVICVLRELDIDVNDSFDYNGHPDSEVLKRKLREHLISIDPNDPNDGDILLFDIGRNPQHVAFMSDGNTYSIIHTHQGVGKVVETHIGSWCERLNAAFAIPGVTDG